MVTIKIDSVDKLAIIKNWVEQEEKRLSKVDWDKANRSWETMHLERNFLKEIMMDWASTHGAGERENPEKYDLIEETADELIDCMEKSKYIQRDEIDTYFYSGGNSGLCFIEKSKVDDKEFKDLICHIDENMDESDLESHFEKGRWASIKEKYSAFSLCDVFSYTSNYILVCL